jgi:hypothetical protein
MLALVEVVRDHAPHEALTEVRGRLGHDHHQALLLRLLAVGERTVGKRSHRDDNVRLLGRGVRVLEAGRVVVGRRADVVDLPSGGCGGLVCVNERALRIVDVVELEQDPIAGKAPGADNRHHLRILMQCQHLDDVSNRKQKEGSLLV